GALTEMVHSGDRPGQYATPEVGWMVRSCFHRPLALRPYCSRTGEVTIVPERPGEVSTRQVLTVSTPNALSVMLVRLNPVVWCTASVLVTSALPSRAVPPAVTAQVPVAVCRGMRAVNWPAELVLAVILGSPGGVSRVMVTVVSGSGLS